MGKFYHLNSTKVTLREFLFGTPWYQLVLFLLPVLLLVKVFRVNVPNSTDDPIVESIEPFEVDPAAIPYEIHQRFQRFSGELTALGFQSPIYHMIVDPLRSTRIYWVTLVHSSGKHIARVHNRVWTGVNKNDRGVFPIFCTPYVDGTFTVSSAGKPDMLSPAAAHVEHHVGASVQQLWERHQLSVEKSGKIPASVGPDDGLRRMIGNWHKVVRDFHIERGVFTPLSEDENQQLASASAVSGMETIPQEDREVFNHIQRIQNQKTSAKKMIPLLVISLILFIIAGRSNRSMDLLMIIPVLVFHELGHFIAMKAFRYTNISMFFIPFLGAAVTGQHYNVPGWKKAIVALAGPVPGILLGIGIGVVAAITGVKLLYTLALMFIAINVFNLLPILPLDGGWVAHSVLFSRHPYLDTAFRVMAAVGLFLLGIVTKEKILMYLGIPMILSLSASWHQANIAYQLRKRGVSGDSPDSYTIPVETAGVILQEIRRAQPKVKTSVLQAQSVLSTFQMLNARPPSAGATVGLIAAHTGAFVIALIGLFAIFASQAGGFGNFMSMASREATYSYKAGSTREWRGAQFPSQHSTERTTIIATCKRDSDAERLYGTLPAQLPPNSSLRIFGRSLLLSLPKDSSSDRRKWVGFLEPQVKKILVDTKKRQVWVSLVCEPGSNTGVSGCEGELRPYFDGGDPSIIPPWTKAWNDIPAQERSTFSLARSTYSKLSGLYEKAYELPSVKQMQQEMIKLQDRGDFEESEQLSKKMSSVIDAEKMRLAGSITGDVDQRVIDLWRQRESIMQKLRQTAGYYDEDEEMDDVAYVKDDPKRKALTAEASSISRKIYACMGQYPDKASAASDPQGVGFGSVRVKGQTMNVSVWSFNDISTGLPALVEWMNAHGATNVKYSFR